jgi:DNA-binding CsgD family transcriptional regulator
MDSKVKLVNRLTLKEKIYLRYVLSGYTANQIADVVKRSRRTVESHLRNIRMKLHCQNKNQLVRLALQHGLVSVDI